MTASAVDRDELRAMVRGMLDEVSTSAAVRAAAESESRFDEALWKQLVDVGWAGIEAPEQHGGGGAAFGDAAVVLVELGRHLTLSPLASTMVLGLGALLLAGSEHQREEWVPRICDGTARGTAALGCDAATALLEDDTWVVTGRWEHVPDADLADFVVLCARTGEREVLLLAPSGGLQVTATPMLDLTRRLCTVEAMQLRLPRTAELGGADAVRAMRDRSALATACDSLGVAERALVTTVEYAKTRVQFDRPIGSFQAVKHTCADMLIAVETSRVAVDTALAAYERDPWHCSLEVSMAKAQTNAAATKVTGDAVVLHGGIGYTWEHDCHLMLKRAKLDEAVDGSTRSHLRRTADLLLNG